MKMLNLSFPASLLLSSTFLYAIDSKFASKPSVFTSRDTIVTVQRDPSLPVPIMAVNVTALTRNASQKEPKYVAIGGKLSAGYRDGGLYRAGQITAYPNLIARQMRLSNFNSPLFNPEEGNGSGFEVVRKSKGRTEWVKVKNNTALAGKDSFVFKKYTGEKVSNLSFPYGPMFVSEMPENSYLHFPDQKQYMAYYNRIISKNEEGTKNIKELIRATDPDICTYERYFDLFLGLAENPLNLQTDFVSTYLNEDVLDQDIIQLKARGTKLVLFTIPQISDFPYFHLYPADNQFDAKGKIFVRYKNNHINPVEATEQTTFLPTQVVQDLFTGSGRQGLTTDNPLNDEDVISDDEIIELKRGISVFNTHYVWRAAKKHSIPVVDLESIYQKILLNTYVSDDGTRIGSGIGEFFSSDGKTPSAIGQAVLANETIKVINIHYKSQIPLIDIKEFKKAISR